MAKKTLQDRSPESIAGSHVVVRVDFNTPMDEEGKVSDDTRWFRHFPRSAI